MSFDLSRLSLTSSHRLSLFTHTASKKGLVKCSMKSYRLSELSFSQVESLKARPRIDFSSIFTTVNPIIEAVRSKGDTAVKEYTERFDKVQLSKVVEDVSELDIPQLDSSVKEAFDVAYDNIYAFHLAQKSAEKSVENMKGVRCKRVSRSIGSVGLYVPGGTAVLPSTALMLAIPAQIAGCKTVTPPTKEGSICKVVPLYILMMKMTKVKPLIQKKKRNAG